MKKTIISVILFIATQLVGAVIGAAVILIPKLLAFGEINTSTFWELYSNNQTPINIFALIFSQIVLFLVFWAMRYFKPADLITKVPLKILLTAVIFIVSSLFVLNLINSALDLPDNYEQVFKEMSDSFFAILSITFLGPVVEEIVFRRIIIKEFLNMSLRPWIAILISAILFGLIHLNPAQMVLAFAAGIIFGWIYYKTGSVLPGIIGHIINNTIGIIELRAQADSDISDQAEHFYNKPWLLSAFIGCLVLAITMAALLNKRYKKDATFTQVPPSN